MADVPVQRVTVEFIETPIQVQVDLSLLTWGDLLDLQRAGASDDVDASKLLTTLVSKVTGQDAKTLPAMVVSAISEEMMKRVNGSQREKN